MTLRVSKNSIYKKDREEENYNQEKYDKPWTIKDFDIGKRLGRGSKGWVFLAREKRSSDQMLVAIKILNKSKMDSDSLKRLTSELINHRSVEHENILKFYCWFEDEDKFYIVLEYAHKGDLFELLNNGPQISEQKAATYIYQLANALKYLHSKNVIHRDIKPENIMIDAYGNLRLGDFGWSIKSTGRRKTLCGTPEYIPPEMIDKKEYDYRVDIWSLGVLCFELLTGSTPFKGESDAETYEKIANFNPVQTKFPNMSRYAKDLIIKMLKRNQNERITLDEVLNHTWIIENAIKERYQ